VSIRTGLVLYSGQATAQSHADSRRQDVRVRRLRQEVHAAAAAHPSSARSLWRQAVRLPVLLLQVRHRRKPPQALSCRTQDHLPTEETWRSRWDLRPERCRFATWGHTITGRDGQREREHRCRRCRQWRWCAAVSGGCGIHVLCVLRVSTASYSLQASEIVSPMLFMLTASIAVCEGCFGLPVSQSCRELVNLFGFVRVTSSGWERRFVL